jgi:hypothetical protein
MHKRFSIGGGGEDAGSSGGGYKLVILIAAKDSPLPVKQARFFAPLRMTGIEFVA